MITGSRKQPFWMLSVVTINTLAAGLASAGPNLNSDVGAGLEYHSNAARTSTDEQSDVARVARAAVTWRDMGGPLLADVKYGAEYRDYQDNIEPDETAVDGHANLQWHAVPRRLDVILQHQISQMQSDLRTVDTPRNRERRSIVTGGVDGHLAFSAVDSLVISPRYTETTFSESKQSDSQRSSAGLNWVHELDTVSRLHLGGDLGRVRFDSSTGQDYDSRAIQLGYETALARLSYSLSGGLTRFDRETQDDVNGHVIRAEVNYRGDGFDVGGNWVRELTDSSIGLSANEFSLASFRANDANFTQVDVIERSQLDMYWRQRLGSTSTVDVLLGGAQDNYKTQLLDQGRAYAEAGYRHNVSALLSVGARLRYERVDFSDDPLGREYKNKTFTLTANYRFTQDFDARLSLSRVDRSANESVFEYTDNVAMLTINYRLF